MQFAQFGWGPRGHSDLGFEQRVEAFEPQDLALEDLAEVPRY